MVKIKEAAYFLSDGTVDPTMWLEQLTSHYSNLNPIRHALALAQLAGEKKITPTGLSCLRNGLAMAEILLDLDVDGETLAAAIIYDSVQYTDLTFEDVEEQLGKNVAKLVLGMKRMDAINAVRYMAKGAGSTHQQIDNLRKMLLAMVDDVRGVLIKLAERLHMLRIVSTLDPSTQHQVAQEVMNIYAPLANRLGVGSMKWEMEDLAFRYLQPEAYKSIAKGLQSRRLDRDNYVKKIVDALETELKKANFSSYKVYGRSKHIHSIYRKMTQKNRSLDEIYDATALRILVETEEDCYAALSLTHHIWEPIASEFDDYITNPKPNGYQSLHTAVIGPENKHFEVQIRTYQMHDLAELGIAAHWKYKEGAATVKEAHERKIEWLREILSWHREFAKTEGISKEIQTEFLEDRVYVFTPKGQIMDLPQGSTPLDFAYHIHSDVGHRCRGAKVNGSIVNLVYALQMGDQVEILAGKKVQPSRDWLNPQSGYLKSSRARAKVLQWFKEQDFERHQVDGEELLEREFKKMNLRSVSIDNLAKQCKFKRKEDFFAALGRGDLKIGTVLQKAAHIEPAVLPLKITLKSPTIMEKNGSSDLYIEGVGNLLTRMAHCCKPSIHDPIIGYVTVGRGISIHRQNCPHIRQVDVNKDNRLVQVMWGEKAQMRYPIELDIYAYDRNGLLRDVTNLMAQENTSLLSFTTTLNQEEHTAHIHLIAELVDTETLGLLVKKLLQIQNVISVERII